MPANGYGDQTGEQPVIPNKDRDRAVSVILEILRQAGSAGLGRIQLYKAFWLAHLFYAKDNPGYLTDWPIVRMPRGPGINMGTILLRELENAGKLKQTTEYVGPFQEFRCRSVATATNPQMSADEVEAIRQAYEFVKGKTATELSEYSHEYSRSWREMADGSELDIYNDLIQDDDEYNERKDALDAAMKATEDVFR